MQRKIYVLRGTYSMQNWNDLESQLHQLKKGTIVDYVNAELDEGCMLLINGYNNLFDDIKHVKSLTTKKEVSKSDHVASFLHFIVSPILYLISLFNFSKLVFAPTVHKFQKEILYQDVINNCSAILNQTLGIVIILSFSTGITMTLESLAQLTDWGMGMLSMNFVVISFLKEMGLFISVITLCSCASSSIIARIGNMRITDEWDSIRVIGLSPYIFLFYPKILAYILLIPLLGYISCFAGFLGGYVALYFTLKMKVSVFYFELKQMVNYSNFWFIFIKGPLFGLVCGLITAMEASLVSLHSENLTKHISRGVIYSIFGAMFVDMLMNVIGYSVRSWK